MIIVHRRRASYFVCHRGCKELISRGSLFTEDIYEEYIQDFKSRKTVVKLCVYILPTIVISCRYCFAGEGEYKGKQDL